MWDELELNIVRHNAGKVAGLKLLSLRFGSCQLPYPEGEGGRRRSVGVPFTLAVAR
jgi:hypothetical protein